MKHQKNWLITGISKGLGKEMAKRVHENGDQVVGFVRRETDKDLLEAELKGIKVYILDLKESLKISAAIDDAIRLFGKIDVLVNNAGYGMFGLFEEISMDELRAQFEINVFAKWFMINSVLPYMRVQESGIIIQISSRLGILAGTGNAAYSATEFAIEGMTESLASEVKPFGIQVALVEPGPMRTSFFEDSITFSKSEIPAYEEFFGDLKLAFKNRDGKQKGDPKKIAEIIFNEVNQETIPFRIPVTAATIDALELKAENYYRISKEWEIKAKSVDTLDIESRKSE